MIPFCLLTQKKTARCGVLRCVVFRWSELSLLPAAAAANGTGLGDHRQGRATQEELADPHQAAARGLDPRGLPPAKALIQAAWATGILGNSRPWTEGTPGVFSGHSMNQTHNENCVSEDVLL